MKHSLRLVPIMVVAFAAVAMGQITNSKHDLRAASSGPNASNRLSGLTQICLPCHTPHESDTTVSEAPLWNHQLTTQTFQMYTTISGRTGDPNGPSKLCLSCHDGVTAMDNYGGTTSGTQAMSGGAALTLNLKDDHPIGLSYPPPTGSYDTVANVEAAGLRLPTVGASKRIECQSCHDPHSPTNGDFLRMSNNGSQLCLTCHTL